MTPRIYIPRLSREAVGFDDFTAANSTSPDRRVNASYINTRYGTVWETHQRDPTGNWFIQSNRLYCTNARRLVMASEQRLRNVEVSVDIYMVTIPTTTRNCGIIVRDHNVASGYNHYEVIYVGPSATATTQSQVRVNHLDELGTRTELTRVDVPFPAVGSTNNLVVVAKDSTIRSFWNGAKVIDQTFMENNASGFVGLYSATMSSTTGFHFDNFYCERLR